MATTPSTATPSPSDDGDGSNSIEAALCNKVEVTESPIPLSPFSSPPQNAMLRMMALISMKIAKENHGANPLHTLLATQIPQEM